MSDSVSEEHPDEIDGSQDDMITTTFQFTLKTFLFGGTKKAKHVAAKKIETQLSTCMSSVVYEFTSDEDVLEYLSTYPHSKLSTMLKQEVSVEVSSYVKDISSDAYDDGIPKIEKLDFGFYAVPQRADFEGYMASVDNGLFVEHRDVGISGCISSESYLSVYGQYKDDEGNLCTALSALSGVNDHYEQTGMSCTFAPYVDRVRWKIDPDSLKSFPDNVKAYSDFEVR